jgi:hypothetical protein
VVKEIRGVGQGILLHIKGINRTQHFRNANHIGQYKGIMAIATCSIHHCIPRLYYPLPYTAISFHTLNPKPKTLNPTPQNLKPDP